MTQPESMSQMGGGASLIGGGPSVLGSGPSSIGGGHGSFIGGPGIHAYQNFPPHRNGPQSGDPAYGAPLSPLRAGSGVASESRMASDVSPSAKASVAFGRSARTRSTSTPGTVPGAVQGTPNRSPHSVRRSGREDGTPPGMSRSPQRRSRTLVSRYSPPTSLRAIRTSAEQPTAMPPVADNTTTAAAAAAAAAQRARRASASDITRTDRADSIGALKSPSGMTPHGLTQQAMTPPASRTNVGDPPAAKPTAAATVNLSPLEKKVAEVQVALRHAKGALSEIQSAREVDQKQMGTFSKSISLVSERLDGIDSAVRTVASATAEAAEAAAAGRKEGVAELREMKGHVESLWRDVAGGKAWQKDADEQLQGLQAELRRASEVADSAEATAEAARAAAAAAAEAADEAAADVARLRDSAAAPHPAERDLHAAAQADAAAAMESATADAAAKAADAAAAAGAAEAVAAVSQELAELRASVTEVRAFRGPAFDTIREDVDELREFHATAKLKFVELDDALERLEEATAADTGVVMRQSAARSLEPSPDQWVGSVVPDEVADRLDDVCRKVGALESQVAVWSKAHGADGEAAHGGSGTSASPPRTPEAYSSYPEDACAHPLYNPRISVVGLFSHEASCMDWERLKFVLRSYDRVGTGRSIEFGVDLMHGCAYRSLDITCDLMVGPQAAPHTGASHREVTASKAGIYTNVYSGPTATLEFSMLADRLDSMGLVVDEVSKAVKTLRADVDSLKTAKARGSTPFSDAGGQGSFGQMFGSDDPERGPGLGDLRCVAATLQIRLLAESVVGWVGAPQFCRCSCARA